MSRYAILIAVVLGILAGNAGVSFAIAEWRMDTIEGPQGERGERGSTGPAGPSAADNPVAIDVAATALDAKFGLERIAQLWALDRIASQNPSSVAITTTNPQVIACMEYITLGENSAAECGFQRD